jgi:hypothetical protein
MRPVRRPAEGNGVLVAAGAGAGPAGFGVGVEVEVGVGVRVTVGVRDGVGVRIDVGVGVEVGVRVGVRLGPTLGVGVSVWVDVGTAATAVWLATILRAIRVAVDLRSEWVGLQAQRKPDSSPSSIATFFITPLRAESGPSASLCYDRPSGLAVAHVDVRFPASRRKHIIRM